MPFRDLALSCPSCRPRRELTFEARGARCPDCGGLFVDEGELLRRIREAQPQHRVDELLEHNDGSPRRPCAVCGARMTIVWLEFLQLDRCEEHGVWLDAGELELALRWDVVPADLRRS
jgi:Zn-finger nucleic acid-binding protein